MRIADRPNRELLQPRPQHFEFCLRRTQRSVECRLVAMVERRKINRFYGRLQLCFAYTPSLGICGNQRSRSENLHAQQAWIGPIRA